jgi:hypothetical protein
MKPKKELEIFKTGINLAEYASTCFDFALDKKKSTNISKFMRSETEKIVISRNANNGSYIYFNVDDDNDKGTIIDFVQNRTKDNFFQIRQRLRAYLKQGHTVEKIYQVSSIPRNNQNISNIYTAIQSEPKSTYLQLRCIDQQVYNNPLFKERVKFKGSEVYFPLYNKTGIVGISIYKQPKISSGLSKKMYPGSEKGIWASHIPNEADYSIFISESPVDNFSYQQLHGGTYWHIATMGTLTNAQIETIKHAVERCKRPVVLGFDNDIKGQEYTLKLSAALADLTEVSTTTPTAKDWNDELGDGLPF